MGEEQKRQDEQTLGRAASDEAPQHTTTRAAGVVRIVVTADNHLSAYTPKLSPQRLSERRQRLRRAFSQVVDDAIARQAHLFIQAGDLFDSTDPRNLEREFVAAQLARLRDAGIRAFAVSGNHDTPRQRTEHGGYSPQGIYAQLGGLHYFADSHRIQPVTAEIDGMRVAIAGLSNNPGAAPGGDPLDGLEVHDPEDALARADVGILVLHAAIEGHGFPGEAESIVRRASLERLTGFQVVLAGHVHAYAKFRVADTSVVVCGATERMEFGEAESAPGFVFLEVDASGLRHAEHVWIPPQPRHVLTVRTAELWPLHTLSAQTDPTPDSETQPGADTLAEVAMPSGDADVADSALDVTDLQGSPKRTPLDVLRERLERFCKPDAMVRLRLQGPITREHYRELDLRQLWIYGQRNAFFFEIDESGLFLTAPGGHERIESAGRVAPHEVLDQIAREWLERATSPEERALVALTRERVLMRYAEMTGQEAGK